MPSFIKTCVASFALLAFTFAPVVVGSPTSPALGLEHLSRRMAGDVVDISSNEARSRTRRESRKDAASRIMAAKRRAAVKAKRALAARDFPTLEPRAKKTTKFKPNTVAAFSAFTQTRCGNTKQCTRSPNAIAPPSNGAIVCNVNSRTCGVDCNSGFTLTATGTCQASDATCPAAPANGAYSRVNGVCTLDCNTSAGFSPSNGACVNTVTDPSNCGGVVDSTRLPILVSSANSSVDISHRAMSPKALAQVIRVADLLRKAHEPPPPHTLFPTQSSQNHISNLSPSQMGLQLSPFVPTFERAAPSKPPAPISPRLRKSPILLPVPFLQSQANTEGASPTFAVASPVEAPSYLLHTAAAGASQETQHKKKRRRPSEFGPEQLLKRFACTVPGCDKTLAR
ncbi:hypothetical protein P7C70_g2922, partial [Phenoliferia sp. Uapishka_3]